MATRRSRRSFWRYNVGIRCTSSLLTFYRLNRLIWNPAKSRWSR